MKEGFVRELYLRSEPSIDLDLVPKEVEVDCNKYTIKKSVYEELLNEYCENDTERLAANLFMRQSGPQLIEG